MLHLIKQLILVSCIILVANACSTDADGYKKWYVKQEPNKITTKNAEIFIKELTPEYIYLSSKKAGYTQAELDNFIKNIAIRQFVIEIRKTSTIKGKFEEMGYKQIECSADQVPAIDIIEENNGGKTSAKRIIAVFNKKQIQGCKMLYFAHPAVDEVIEQDFKKITFNNTKKLKI